MIKKTFTWAACLAVGGTLVLGQAVPTGTGLIAYWTLNDATATDPVAAETSGAAPQNTGTYMGATLPTTSATVPMVGGAAHPPGNTASRVFTQATANQRVEVPDNTELDLTGAFTLAAWVMPTGAQTNQLGIIEHWSGLDMNPAINGYFLRLSATLIPKVSIGNGTTQYEVPSAGFTPIAAAPTWTHVAATFNGTDTLRLYINGALNNSSNAVTPPTAGAAALHIGVDYGANRFNGNIDDVRIYNRMLSDTEVSVLSNGLAAPVIGSLVPGPGSVTVSWGAVANATSYQVFQGTSATGPWISAGTTAGTSLTDMNVNNPIQYWYYVVAQNVINSPDSAVAGPVVPQSATPRTEGNDEGLFEDNCACGSTAFPSLSPFLLFALAALGLRRRSS